MAGIHWARGRQPAPPSKSPNLLYHGGPVMYGTLVAPIFWGARWMDSAFVNDKVNGLQTFYAGIGSSGYAQTNTEYTDSSGRMSASVSLGAASFDFSDVTANGQRTGPILAECARTSRTLFPTAAIPYMSMCRAATLDSVRGTAPALL
ncbi:MAG TPA: hypothetical protein VKE51_16005 [Vicinamibacterales bacterium]|nr:hypothetical protein [Vicinamibacterales bacterium]